MAGGCGAFPAIAPASCPAVDRGRPCEPVTVPNPSGKTLTENPNRKPCGGETVRRDRGRSDAANGCNGCEPIRQTVRRDRHGTGHGRGRLSGRPSGKIGTPANLSPSGGEIAADGAQERHRRRGKSGRGRTRPAHGNATAGGCALFPAIVPAPCPARRGRSDAAHLSGRLSGGLCVCMRMLCVCMRMQCKEERRKKEV